MLHCVPQTCVCEYALRMFCMTVNLVDKREGRLKELVASNKKYCKWYANGQQEHKMERTNASRCSIFNACGSYLPNQNRKRAQLCSVMIDSRSFKLLPATHIHIVIAVCRRHCVHC